jgi:two-component system cell cycle sensor histidine kinase/response regulator CckA
MSGPGPAGENVPGSFLAAEDHYRILVEGIMDHAIFMLDPEGIVVSWNRGAERINGYSPDEIIGQHFSRFYSAEDIARHEPWTELEIAKSRGRFEDEGWRVRKDGSRMWASVVITALRDPHGTLVGFAKVTRDMTERQRLAEAEAAFTRKLEQTNIELSRHRHDTEARHREERFRQLADNIDEVFFVIDSQLRQTLYINPAYEKVWGRSCQSLYDDPQSFMAPLPDEDRARLQEHLRRIQRGERPDKVSFRVVQPNGSVRWVLGHAVPIRNEQGEVYRIAGVSLDITESREAQLALEESADRFRKLALASFDAIHVAQDGILLEVNPGFLEMFGYDRMEEVIGRPVTDFAAEESRAEVERRYANNIDGTYEVVGRRKDGKKILLEVTGKTHTIDGRQARITALRDMTEKRSLEDQFRQAQKMEAVGRLAGGVAHDFNNLLTVIMSYTDMLLEEVSPQDPRAEDLDQIRKAAVAAASLTRQLLAFSRQQVIEPRLVNLSEIVSMSQKMLDRLIGDDVEVVTTLTSEPVAVMIDPGQLEQVIMNLAVNARDAMPQGGRLILETASVKMDAEFARDHWPANPGRFAMLAVTDTGTGMDEQTLARIFEPFFTTKEIGKGTGLGLAMAYGIVKQSNGFIRVFSEPGHGTTFRIYFPLVDEAAERYVQPELAQLQAGTETILLAEDSAAVRVAARQILERLGYTVLEAPSGRDALNIASKRVAPIHLLLTDVVMPEMSGRELTEQFARLRPDAKVLYMSGYTDDAIVRHGILRPGIAYLQKPFSPDTLARKVREVLDSSGKRDSSDG